MAKKERIPQYVMSQLNTPMLNYRVYVIPTQKKIMLILGLFVIGGLLGQVFYGNLFLNSDGEMTKASYISNFVVFIIVGLIVIKVAYPMVLDRLKSKRKMELTNQFRSFLEAIAVSLSSGMNVPDALISANNDLRMEYSDCLLYTSDAADDATSVDLGGRRIIKKIFFKQKTAYEICRVSWARRCV